tara:strand:- start:526 stop:705 length:180 start_codon:yes stop_codon:yes gene_type:complete
LYKVLEVLGEECFLSWFGLAMSLPENISPVGGQTSVERILVNSLREWRMLGHHDEKNDG